MIGVPPISSDLQRQIIRFGVVGCFNTTFSYSVYSLGIFIELPYYLASLFALILGIVLSYITQGKLVFRSGLKGRFPAFLLTWSLIYFLNIFLIKAFSEIGMDYYFAGLMALIPVVILSFLLQKFVVFGRPASPND